MSLVQPFTLWSLPAVGAARGRASRLPWQWCGRLDHPTILGLSGAGVMRLSWDGFQQGIPAAREDLYLTDGDGRRGRVSIDRWLALNLVARTLGLPPPKSLRRLGPGESGILAGHLAALVTFATGSLNVDLAGARGEEVLEGTIGLGFQAEAAGARGPVRLDLPPQWLALVPDGGTAPPVSAGVPAMARLEVTAHIELADTTLPLSVTAQTAIADTVVFDGQRPQGPHEELPVRVRIGEFEAAALVRADGAVVYLGPFLAAPRGLAASATGTSEAASVVESRHGMDSGTDDRKLQVLAAAPVEVVAELGRVTLRGDEVLGLERGSVLAFNQRRGQVDLVVAGRIWARGELVNVDGELGVRISEMLHAARPADGAP